MLICIVVLREDAAPYGTVHPLFKISLTGTWIPFLLRNEVSDGPLFAPIKRV